MTTGDCINAVNRFDVIVISVQFLQSDDLSPLPFLDERLNRVEIPREVFFAATMKEVEAKIPSIIADLSSGEHVRIIHYTGECCECAVNNICCPHLGRTIPSVKRVNVLTENYSSEQI